MSDVCEFCGRALPARTTTRGPKPRYCGGTCRKKASLRRIRDRDAETIERLTADRDEWKDIALVLYANSYRVDAVEFLSTRQIDKCERGTER